MEFFCKLDCLVEKFLRPHSSVVSFSRHEHARLRYSEAPMGTRRILSTQKMLKTFGWSCHHIWVGITFKEIWVTQFWGLIRLSKGLMGPLLNLSTGRINSFKLELLSHWPTLVSDVNGQCFQGIHSKHHHCVLMASKTAASLKAWSHLHGWNASWMCGNGLFDCLFLGVACPIQKVSPAMRSSLTNHIITFIRQTVQSSYYCTGLTGHR